jgi:hypothetical protein
MLKRLHDVAVAASLIICIVAAAFWAQSYDGHNSIIRTRYLPPDPGIKFDDITAAGVRSSEVIGVVDGEFVLGSSKTPARGVGRTSGWHLFRLPSRNLIGDEDLMHRLGLDLTSRTTPRGKSMRLEFPMWLAVAVTAILPGWWYFGWSRKRTRSMSLCSLCGYNLTDLVVRTCPNCGMQVARPSPATTPSVRTSAS